VIDVASVEHFGKQIEAVDVRLEAARGVFNRCALIDLERPITRLSKEGVREPSD